MAKTKTQQEKTESKPVKVRCCDCWKNFTRDTEGISFCAETGEFFMGICEKGHKDGVKKVFADKLRICKDYNND